MLHIVYLSIKSEENQMKETIKIEYVNPAKELKDQSTRRAAYSPAEFAALCGRHPSWAYRLLYCGKISALTDLGRILIPASELDRVLSSAAPYNPQPRKSETQSAKSSATIGGGEER